MADITLQVRSAKGAKRITISASASLTQLRSTVQEATGVKPEWQVLKAGYPPKPIQPLSPEETLEALGIRHGETIIVEEDKTRPVASLPIPPEPIRPSNPSQSSLIRRVIASDNSCLFNAVGYALEGRRRDAASELRDIIAGFILSDPVTYNEGLLGKVPEVYCQWIRLPASWGGAPELAILAQYYQVQIACVSIQTIRIDQFGDSPNRIYLLYDNIHYDIIVRNTSPTASEASDATIFPSSDSTTEAEALALARDLQQQRQFTDLTGCTLMCGVCNQGFKGQKEAIRHGNETGHMNFQEVSR